MVQVTIYSWVVVLLSNHHHSANMLTTMTTAVLRANCSLAPDCCFARRLLFCVPTQAPTGRKKRRASVTGEELEDPNNESALVEYQPPGADFANLLLNFMDSQTVRAPEWEAPPLTAFDGLSLGDDPLLGEPMVYPPPPLMGDAVPVPVTVVPQPVMSADGVPPVPDVVTVPPAPGMFSLGEPMQPIVQSPPVVDFEELGLSPDLMASMDSAPMGDAAGDDSFWQTLLNNADSLPAVKHEPASPTT